MDAQLTFLAFYCPFRAVCSLLMFCHNRVLLLKVWLTVGFLRSLEKYGQRLVIFQPGKVRE